MKRRTSNLTRATTFYLQTRRRLGFRLKSEGWALPSLVRYARRREHRGALTSKLAIDWAQSSTQASPPQRACRLNQGARLVQAKKELRQRTLRAHRAHILPQRAGDLRQQRQQARSPALGPLQAERARLPVHLLKAQLGNLLSPQSQPGRQERQRIIAHPGSSARIKGAQ